MLTYLADYRSVIKDSETGTEYKSKGTMEIGAESFDEAAGIATTWLDEQVADNDDELQSYYLVRVAAGSLSYAGYKSIL